MQGPGPMKVNGLLQGHNSIIDLRQEKDQLVLAHIQSHCDTSYLL